MLRKDLRPDRFAFDEELVESGYLSDLIFPLNHGGQTIGTANFTCSQSGQLDASHQALAEPLIDLITLCAVRIQEELDRQAIQHICQAVQS